MIKKFSRQHSTHEVESVRWTRGAAAVAIEARNRICTARLQLGTEDIGFIVHSPSVAKCCVPSSPSDADTLEMSPLWQAALRCGRSLGNDAVDPVVDRSLPDPLPDTTAMAAGAAVGT